MSEPEVECTGELTWEEKDARGRAGAIDLEATPSAPAGFETDNRESADCETQRAAKGAGAPQQSTVAVVKEEEGAATSAAAGIEQGNADPVDAEARQQPDVVVKKEGPAPAGAACTFSEQDSLDRLMQLATAADEQRRKDHESQQLARVKDEEHDRQRLARYNEDDEGRRRDHAGQQLFRQKAIKAESAQLKTLAPPGANRPMEPLETVPSLGALEASLDAEKVSAADALGTLHCERTDLSPMLGSFENPGPLAEELLRRLAPGYTLTCGAALLAEAAFSGGKTSHMLRTQNGGDRLRVRLYALLSLRGALALLPPRVAISSLAGDVAACLATPRPDLTDGTRGALLALGDAIPRLKAQMTLAAVPSLGALEGGLAAERVSAADALGTLLRERTDLSAMLGSFRNPGRLAEELLRRLAPEYTLTYCALLAEAAFSGGGTSHMLRTQNGGNGLRVRLYALLSLRGALALLPPRVRISSLAGDVATCLAAQRPDLTDGTRGALLALGDAIPRSLEARMEPLEAVPSLEQLEASLAAERVSAADALATLHLERTDLSAMLGSEANPGRLAEELLRRLAPEYTLTYRKSLLPEAAFSGGKTSHMLRTQNGGDGLRVRLYALLSLRGALALLPPRVPISSLAGDVATCLATPRPDLTDGTRGALLVLGDAIPRFLEAQMHRRPEPVAETTGYGKRKRCPKEWR